MAYNTSTVSAGDQALASQYNNLRLDVLERSGEYAATTGSANAYLLSVDAAVTGYVTGMVIVFEASFTNTASATINVNSIGAKTLKMGGSNLDPYTLISGYVYTAVYDGTNFEIVSKYSNYIYGTAGETLAAGDFVYEDSADGKLNKASQDVSSDSEAANVIGVIVTGGATDDIVAVQPMYGQYTTSGLTAGSTYYLGTGGAITTTHPSMNTSTVIPLIIGVARSTTELIFRPQRLQRRKQFNGSASTTTTDTVTIGFTVGYVELFANGETGNNFLKYEQNMGYTDLETSGLELTTNTSKAMYIQDNDASGTIDATISRNGTNIDIDWTATSFGDTINYVGTAYESI